MDVLLADDRAQVRWALRTFLQEHLDLTVVGEVAESETLLAQALVLRPDLILLEWELPGQPAGEILATLHRQQGSCRIVVVSQHPECRAAALGAGADAFVCKTAEPEQVAGVLLALGVEVAHGI
jgi:DNA-binding NarL/FixJ family response regulator